MIWVPTCGLCEAVVCVFPVGCVHSPLCSRLYGVLLTDCEQSNSADSNKTLAFQGSCFMKRVAGVALFKHNTSSCQASVRTWKSSLSAKACFVHRSQTWHFSAQWNSSPKTIVHHSVIIYKRYFHFWLEYSNKLPMRWSWVIYWNIPAKKFPFSGKWPSVNSFQFAQQNIWAVWLW